MLKQDAMTPLYVQLMDTVEKDIKSGRYKPGDKIMTESEMAKTYGVSLITVRKAIGSLMEKGLVVRKQGKRILPLPSEKRYTNLVAIFHQSFLLISSFSRKDPPRLSPGRPAEKPADCKRCSVVVFRIIATGPL